jgi:hypothetical protein
MPKITPFDNRPISWHDKKSAGHFAPEGKPKWYGVQPNPRSWSSEKETWIGRVIVGFARRGKKDVTMNELVAIVRRVRELQTRDPSSTFLAQRGLYRHRDSGEVVDEDGAQVVIIDTHDTPPKKFEKQIEELAEILARQLGQEEVIVEIQKNGISQTVFGVGP